MEDQEVRLRELQEECSNYRELQEHIGWVKLMEIAEGQVELRLPAVLDKLDNLLEATGQEYEKGVIQGIKLFSQLPGIQIESLEQDINLAEKELENEPGDRTVSGRAGTSTSGGDASGGDFEPPI